MQIKLIGLFFKNKMDYRVANELIYNIIHAIFIVLFNFLQFPQLFRLSVGAETLN